MSPATEKFPIMNPQTNTNSFFSEGHLLLRQKLQAFMKQEILPHVEDWEQQRRFPLRSILKKLGQQELLGLRYPSQYGGQNQDIFSHIVFAEELGRIPSAGISMAIIIHNDMVAPLVADYGTATQCEELLSPALRGDLVFGHAVSEASAGSDVAAIQATAVRENDYYVLNGVKNFVTNGLDADVYCVLAAMPDRNPLTGMVLLFVPRSLPGIEISQEIGMMGHRTANVASVSFQDVRVPASCRIGNEGGGFLAQLNQFAQEHIISSCRATAMADEVLRLTVQHCRSRVTFGEPLIKNQWIQFKIAELRTEIELSRQCNYVAASIWQEQGDISLLSAMAKLQSSRLVRKVADECLQLFGKDAYLDDHIIGRFYRDSRLFSISTGSDEMMLTKIAKISKIS